jgi:predicted GIY-YIG superfamily endonuclease
MYPGLLGRKETGDFMFYTYILRSISRPDERYIGSTEDLKARLVKHNKGDVPHTAKFLPWKIESYFAFETREKAATFEQYLKSGSGHAFAKRHF